MESMSHPFLQTELEIQWDKLTPDHIVPDITKGLQIAKSEISALCAIPETNADYENVICGLENALRPLSSAWDNVFHLKAVCDSPEIRKAYNEMLPKVSSFFSSVHLNSALWKVIKAASASKSIKELNPVQKRFLDETVADFVNAGADLKDEEKEQISEIDTKLSTLTQKYSENTLDSLNSWELILENRERLAGVPENTVETLRKQAQKKGYSNENNPKYLITLHYPIVEPILTYASDRELRKELLQAVRNIARKEPYDNKHIVKEILSLRHKKAKILGKKISQILYCNAGWQRTVKQLLLS